MKIAFDIDDTLLVPSVATGSDRDTPNYETIAIFKWFQAQGHDMILWSGSGIDWAKTWGEKLGLQPFTVRVKEKADDVDLAFDDCEVDLAKVNVRVKRINNKVSRAEWNKKDKREPLGCPHGGGNNQKVENDAYERGKIDGANTDGDIPLTVLRRVVKKAKAKEENLKQTNEQ